MAMKAEGRLRYVGITTSEGRRHREFEQIMREHPLDFVQFSYNVLDARPRRVATARARSPHRGHREPSFRQGDLTRALARQPLPSWAAEIGCSSWPRCCSSSSSPTRR